MLEAGDKNPEDQAETKVLDSTIDHRRTDNVALKVKHQRLHDLPKYPNVAIQSDLYRFFGTVIVVAHKRNQT